MHWLKNFTSADELCFSLPLYPSGHPLVTENARPCYPVVDAVLELVIFALGCTANLITISLILYGSKRPFSKPTGGESVPRLLVLALCVTEFSFLIFGETAWVVSFLAGRWTGGTPAYLYSVFVVVVCQRLSKCIAVFMGLERYLSIKKPFFHDNYVTQKRVAVVIFALIIYSVSFAGFFIAGVLTRTIKDCSNPDIECGQVSKSLKNSSNNITMFQFEFTALESAYEFYTTLEVVIMSGILISCNIVVIKCMQRLKASLEFACPRNREEYVKQVDMIRGAPADFSCLMVSVAVVFVVCILPYQIRWFANQLGAWHSPTLDYIAVRLYFSTCVINPLMYGIFRRSVRRKIKEKTLQFCRHYCLCSPYCRRNRVRPQEAVVGPLPLSLTVSGFVDSRGT